MNRLTLSLALTPNHFSRPLIDGSVAVQGVEFIPTTLNASELYWRQLRFGDFDVSEMSLSSLYIAHARGNRQWTALPVFNMRRFFHTLIMVRKAAGIRVPADLRGKRVGVPEYQQTSAVWSRGVLQHEFDVRPGEIEWFMERGADRSHGAATGFAPPPGVRVHQIAPESSIGEMLLGGSLDATLLYLRSDNLVDRSKADLGAQEAVSSLFADPLAEGCRYHARTGLYPINHTVVVRTSLLEQHPWLALNLYTGFVAAREAIHAIRRSALAPWIDTGSLGVDVVRALQSDPAPYGLKYARRELATIARYLHEQGLTGGEVALDEVFAPSTLEL